MSTRPGTILAVVLTLLLGAFGLPAVAEDAPDDEPFSHEDEYRSYRGTRTCLKCHKEEAETFFYSQHYQWKGHTPDVANADGRQLGKLDMINDFCTNPRPNWIGQVKNADGKVVAKGCSGCHAGNGLLPAEEISREQLENMDCLICHAQGYRRDLYADDEGNWEWRPILWNNKEGLDIISKRLSSPTRANCLRCHSASGGGPNWKRGDLEYVLTKPERTHDVHMSPNGEDMTCVTCHGGDDHRVVGRGVDLAATDTPDQPLGCAGDCHEGEPHAVPILNRHGRVDCTVCHVPTFARHEETDMRRDWSTPFHDVENGKYKATITLESDVVPTYAWYNGASRLQLPGEPIARNDDGVVPMAVPLGSKDDPDARLFPFKLHTGRLPFLTDSEWLLPIAVEEFFADGDIDHAVRSAAEQFYGLAEIDYDWVEVSRYMGIYHGVVPGELALQCLDCHRPEGGRIDWQALGYEADPFEGVLELLSAGIDKKTGTGEAP